MTYGMTYEVCISEKMIINAGFYLLLSNVFGGRRWWKDEKRYGVD